mmetsp:Transcript_20375/g.48448  ORF Transcript_20375/g.48448 Transcript_20375/m.48448 type:complete len:427 (-) Transcript_20375:1435-2715(-)
MANNSTTIGAPTKAGTFSFRILDFNFHTMDMQPGEKIETTPVAFAGQKWSIQLVASNDSRGITVSLRRETIGCNKIQPTHAGVTVSSKSGNLDLGEVEFTFKGLQSSGLVFSELDLRRFMSFRVSVKIYKQFLSEPSDNNCWYPNIHDMSSFLIDMFNEPDEKKDLQFFVGQTSFPVHRFVIEKRAPALFDIIDEFTGHGPIPIGEVDQEIFAIIIQSIYDCFKYTDAGVWNSLGQTRAVLSLADRFGCSKLKMYAESVLVDKYLTVETIGSLLVLADSHSCPLLKEAAQHLYLKDPVVVSKTDGWERIASKSPKLMRELLDSIFSITSPNFATSEDWKKMMINEKPTVLADFMHSILETKNGSMVSTNSKTDQADDADVNKWSVTKLRRELSKERLDLDGSKEILIQRWNDHNNSNNSMDTTTTG